ncbi:MAG: hypothetical protein H6550_02645 [Chitinophagales bacterium]|nr:hypothetical protein [Chitinophagales bacterium]
MGCVLRIMGENFDVDAFELKTGLVFDNKTHKGEPRFKNKPDGQKFPHSVLSVKVSEADFDSRDKQINDAKKYIERHYDKLLCIRKEKEIQHAFLDFGFRFDPEEAMLLVYFPSDIVSLAGGLGIGIQATLYNKF